MRFALLLCLGALTTACVSQDKFRKKEAEASELRSRGEELQARLSESERERGLAGEELQALKAQLEAVSTQLEAVSTSKSRLESAKAELEKKSTEYETLANALRGQIDAGRVELTELRGKMTVKMKDKILFASGSASLGKDGKEALGAVADVLRGVDGKVIRVEGHTDDVPLGRGPFATNWELSAARALAVVRFLQDAGVDPSRLAAAGYGEFQPIAANDTPEGRSQNRRIEIVLAPADAPEAPVPPSQM